MKILIRADASIFIGSGHVMRCLVLAKQLSNYGHEIIFVTKPQTGDFVSYIANQGFKVIKLNRPEKVITPSSSNDYQAWLQGAWEDDANDFISKTSNVDIVIVDHYSLDLRWEKKVANKLSCKIIVIDDLVREHFAEMIVDQTYGREIKEYLTKNSRSRVLSGSEFALISPDFQVMRDRNKKVIKDKNILVSMGAIDYPNATMKVLEQLATFPDRELMVTVLLGEKSPHYQEVKEYCFNKHNFNHISFTDDMAQLMSTQYIAIGAPGSTTWERACMGLPSIIIPIADNQKNVAKNISKTGAVCLINIDDIEYLLHDKLDLLFNDWNKFHLASLMLCDGKGAMRVCENILRLIEKT